MNTSLPKPSQPQPSQVPSELKRSVAPSGVPKMEGANPALAPKQAPATPPVGSTAPVSGASPATSPSLSVAPGGPLAGKAPAPVGVTPPSMAGSRLNNPAPGLLSKLPTLGAAKTAAPAVGTPTVSGVPTTPGAGQPPKPLMAQPKRDPKKMGLIALVVILLLGGVWFLVTQFMGGGTSSSTSSTTNTGTKTGAKTTPPAKQVVLTYWGLWEPSAVLDETLRAYETAHPGVKIDYRIQSHKDYRERLQTAIASGNGPDIFRYHASWVPMLGEDLSVLPATVMSAADFKTTFYPSAVEQLQIDGKIVGLPMMYEGLGLYYNKDILQTAGVEPPTTWAELKKLASELSVPADKNARKSGTITRGGLAIGNTTNVEHFPDILGLLILQNGGDPGEPAFTEVRDALTFYTNFVKEDAVWNSSLPSSTVAFARGDAAMMFAPTWRAHEVRELNPKLNFAVAPVPQLSEDVVAWSSFWAEGVSEKSANKQEAWEFLKYMTSADVMKKLYSAQSQIRAFGEPYSRVDIAAELKADPYVQGVLQDAPIATSWYMNSATHDNGINDQIISYYTTAVNSMSTGEDMEEILLTLEKGVKQVLRQYGVESTDTTTKTPTSN